MRKLFLWKLLKRVLVSRAMFVIIAFVGVGVGAYFYLQYQHEKQVLGTKSTNQQQLEQVVKKVERLIEVPTDESPTLATVTDVMKLKNQPFFANAKNGFKVLIYTKAKKAILYDPFIDKIVEVAPVNLGNQAEQGSLAPQASTGLLNIQPTVSVQPLPTKKSSLTGTPVPTAIPTVVH